MQKKSFGSIMSRYFIIVIFVAVVIIFAAMNPKFIAVDNLKVILKQTSIIGIASFGMMFVIISGGFDMSVGSTMAFTGILSAILGNGQYPIIVPLIAALAGGFAVGIVNGIGIAKGNIPPFIMTLGTMQAARGLALVVSKGKTVTGLCAEFKSITSGDYSLAIIFIVVIIVCSFILSKTVFGRRVYACGGNIQAARVAGINTTFIKIAVFTIMGVLAGFCGFLLTSRTTVGQPTAADGYEMDAITSCVIGGVSMSGGIGKSWGVVVGAFLITVVTNGLNGMGVDSSWQKVVKGAIIVIAVLIDIKTKERKN